MGDQAPFSRHLHNAYVCLDFLVQLTLWPVGVSAIPLAAVGIACLVVGLQYQDACKNSIAYYLEVEGVHLLGWSILGVSGVSYISTYMCWSYLPCKLSETAETLCKMIALVGLISGISIHLWGSIVIFGKKDLRYYSNPLLC